MAVKLQASQSLLLNTGMSCLIDPQTLQRGCTMYSGGGGGEASVMSCSEFNCVHSFHPNKFLRG